MRRKVVLVAVALAAGFLSAQAAPVIQTAGVTVTASGAPLTFLITFSMPVTIGSASSVTTSVIGAYGDGARDGASITPTTPGALVSTSLGGGAVAWAGGAASFDGDGGTGGVVSLGSVAVTDLGAPSQFFVTFLGSPGSPITSETLSQGAIAGGIMDGGFDGATLIGNHLGGGLARFLVRDGVTAVGSHVVGASPLDETAPFIASGSALVPCTSDADCDNFGTELSFDLSGGGDVAAMLVRHELGGDRHSGTVLASYGIESGSGVFDCATIVGGCTLLTTTLAFTLSGGGDAAAFAIRVVVDSADVPEPGTLALLGFGLAGLAASRRRKQ